MGQKRFKLKVKKAQFFGLVFLLIFTIICFPFWAPVLGDAGHQMALQSDGFEAFFYENMITWIVLIGLIGALYITFISG